MAVLRRGHFHRFAVLWTTLVTVALITTFAATIGVYAPEAAEQIGYLPFIILNVGVLLAGVGAHALHSRSAERSILRPLQRISDVTQAIVEGALSGRIELSKDALEDVAMVAESINRLATKATKDIEEMKRLERVRSEFIGNVSHELRTPIFSVQGYLETLLDGALEDPEVSKQFLEKAYQNALRLNALLSDLIDISRIESGELRLSFRYFDIGDLLKELVHNMEIRGLQRDVKLELDLQKKDNAVYGDKERLTQVLTNLIDNAIKYNTDGGTVTDQRRKEQGRGHRLRQRLRHRHIRRTPSTDL